MPDLGTGWTGGTRPSEKQDSCRAGLGLVLTYTVDLSRSRAATVKSRLGTPSSTLGVAGSPRSCVGTIDSCVWRDLGEKQGHFQQFLVRGEAYVNNYFATCARYLLITIKPTLSMPTTMVQLLTATKLANIHKDESKDLGGVPRIVSVPTLLPIARPDRLVGCRRQG